MDPSCYTLTFTRRSDGASLSIDLISHYTCIYGVDSGEGKTELVAMLNAGLRQDTISVSAPFPFSVADGGSLGGLLSNPERQIILVDEPLTYSESFIQRMNKSKHLIVCVTRSLPLRNSYPLHGIYLLHRLENGWFAVSHDPLFQMAQMARERPFDAIVTEARTGRGENELLSVYLDKLVAAAGRDRIASALRRLSGDVLVFTDLGNIGQAYAQLRKRIQENPNICFYEYDAFEQLLVACHLAQSLDRTVDLEPLDYLTLERYYEALLEQKTAGTSLAYKHGQRLSQAFLEKSALYDVLDTPVGRSLLQYILKWGDTE